MSYEKRMCVLKQVKKGFSADGGALTGSVWCERLGETLTVTPKLVGIAPVKEGRYALVLCAEGKTLVLELKGNTPLRVEGAPSVKGGFAALVAFLRGEAEPVAFGACGNVTATYETLLTAVREKKQLPPMSPSPFETPAPVSPNVPRAPVPGLPGEDPFREEAPSSYDDEAIAAVDYFSSRDAQAAGDGGEEAEKTAGGGDPREDAPAPLDPRGSLTYYRELRGRLERAFAEFPRDERLKAVFPQSEWVRKDEALIGVIFRAGQPRYLCVAAEKRGDPPPEMAGRAVFVPTAGDEEGFWVVFQDADTGETVTVSLA